MAKRRHGRKAYVAKDKKRCMRWAGKELPRCWQHRKTQPASVPARPADSFDQLVAATREFEATFMPIPTKRNRIELAASNMRAAIEKCVAETRPIANEAVLGLIKSLMRHYTTDVHPESPIAKYYASNMRTPQHVLRHAQARLCFRSNFSNEISYFVTQKRMKSLNNKTRATGAGQARQTTRPGRAPAAARRPKEGWV
jgi:hypothetical protein